MTDDIDPQGHDEHYQPWLHRQDGPPIKRPQPLPTARGDGAAPQVTTPDDTQFDSMAAQQRQRAAAMSADELLARPIAIPPVAPQGPGMAVEVSQRIGGALGAFADWTIALGQKADVPGRIARMELGRRAAEAGAATGRLIGRGAASTSDAAKAAMDAAGRASDAAAPRIKAAADAAKHGIAKGASAAGAGIGGAARKMADAAPIPALGGKAEPVVESQLDRLMEADAAAATATRTSKPSPALPLFAETAPEAVVAAGAVSATPPVASPSATVPTASAAASASASVPAPAKPQSGNPPPRPPFGIGRRAGGSGGGGFPTPGSIGEWSRHPATWALGGLLLLVGGFAGGSLWSGPGINREATERTVHDYLLNHPEIIPQAMEKLQSDRQAEAVNRLRGRIERPFSGAWAGAAEGDVTLTVFTDYACTFCRASVPDIDRLLREDRKLKVVYRELPILSRDSEPAARLALVAARRGRYMAMHRALFASGNPDSAARIGAADELAVAADNAVLNDAAITRELESNVAIARELGFDGTPSWVVGNKLLTGAVGYDQLRAAVAAARAE